MKRIQHSINIILESFLCPKPPSRFGAGIDAGTHWPGNATCHFGRFFHGIFHQQMGWIWEILWSFWWSKKWMDFLNRLDFLGYLWKDLTFCVFRFEGWKPVTVPLTGRAPKSAALHGSFGKKPRRNTGQTSSSIRFSSEASWKWEWTAGICRGACVWVRHYLRRTRLKRVW